MTIHSHGPTWVPGDPLRPSRVTLWAESEGDRTLSIPAAAAFAAIITLVLSLPAIIHAL